jgi:HD-like signal output (HDOD) protein
MRRLLFVDDEPNVLRGLHRMLHSMQGEWDTAFATSGQEALEMMSSSPFDVVVTDMRMPGMDGLALLEEVRRLYPQMVRIVLSGHADKDALLRSVGPIHQFLTKPCEPEALLAAVARACNLHRILAVERIQTLISRMQSLPALPAVYNQLVDELQSPEASTATAGQIISRDVGMSAKILQLVNSAFFGLPRQVASPAQAVVLLGFDTVRSLVLSVHLFSTLGRSTLAGLPLKALSDHSVAVAAAARRIAEAEGLDRLTVDCTFGAGLLHDVGRLVLAAELTDEYKQVLDLARRERVPLIEAERRLLDATHEEVGAYLLGLWGLADAMIEAASAHHWPSKLEMKGFGPLAAVHVANALVGQTLPSTPIGSGHEIDEVCLFELGMGDRIEKWKRLCKQV